MGLGFLWYVTKVLLLQLKIKWAGLLFLCGGGKKAPQLHPHCRQVTPQRELLLVLQTFTPSPIFYPFISIPPTQSQPAPSPPMQQ